jgi:hypothetical protein
MGDSSQGIILANQPQGVRPGGNGITIRPDGVIEINSQTIVGVMKLGQTPLSAANAYNGYTWPSSAGTAGQQLETDGNGLLSWADADGIDWTQKGQLVAATGAGTANQTLLNAGVNTSFLVADSFSTSGLAYSDSVTSAALAPAGNTLQRPSGPAAIAGQFRFNTLTKKFEFFTGTTWEEIASGDPTVSTFVVQTVPAPLETASALIPAGTTGERQTSPAPVDGAMRFNTTTGQLEVYDSPNWEGIPSSSVGTFVGQTIPPAGKTASAIIPPGPTGQEESVGVVGGYMRYNTTNNLLEFYNGTTWELVAPSGGGVTSFVQNAAPAAFNTGDLWYNPLLGRESVWDGFAWVQPGVTQTGPAGAAIIPAGNATTDRPASPTAGAFRYNSVSLHLEFWDGFAWQEVASSDPAVGTFVSQTTPLAGTPSAVIPAGQTIDRQTNPPPLGGYTRFNTDTTLMEVFDGTIWTPVGAPPNAGLGLNLSGVTPNQILKVSISQQSVPPTPGTLAPEAINGSLYWDDVLSQLFIRYANGGAPTWVAAAPSAGSLAAATLAEAQAGTVNLKYSSPETAVPKNASGMTGSAYIPAGNTAARPAATAYAGQFRYNTQIPQLEYSDGVSWLPVGATAATLAEAAAGVLNTKYSSPETAVPKNASGMTGSALIPAGNTGARPAAASYTGALRYNTQIPQMEYSDGVSWLPVGAAAATLAEAAAGVLTTKYSSPETAVPKDAAGMTGAAIIPSGTDAQRAAIAPLVVGMQRFNTDSGYEEVYTGVTFGWRKLEWLPPTPTPLSDLTISANGILPGGVYNNVTINAGVTATASGIVEIIAYGNVTISGSINGSGTGLSGPYNSYSISGATNVNGGTSLLSGQGPGGGTGPAGALGAPSPTPGGAAYSPSFLIGSTGSAGYIYSNENATNVSIGGNSAASVIIKCYGTITVGASASIILNGGNGVAYAGGLFQASGGGGGSGGLLYLKANNLSVAGTISCNGGNGANALVGGGGGGGGGGGYIILNYSGTYANTASLSVIGGTPGATINVNAGGGGGGFGGAGGAAATAGSGGQTLVNTFYL